MLKKFAAFLQIILLLPFSDLHPAPKQHPYATKISYQKVWKIIESIEKTALRLENSSYSNPEALRHLNILVAHLAHLGARYGGVLETNIVVRDIIALLGEESDWEIDTNPFSWESRFQIDYGYSTEFIPCKGFFQKAAKNTGKFISKHKREIIIAVVIVVAIGVGIYIASALPPEISVDEQEQKTTDLAPQIEQFTPEENYVEQEPLVEKVLAEVLAKETSGLTEEISLPVARFLENIKEGGADCLHEIWEEFSQTIILVENTGEKIKEAMNTLVPNIADHLTSEERPGFEEVLAAGHKKIDEWLGQEVTFHASGASPYEEVLHNLGKPTIGVIPPPLHPSQATKTIAESSKILPSVASSITVMEDVSSLPRSTKALEEFAPINRSSNIRIQNNIWEIEGNSIKKFDANVVNDNKKMRHIFEKEKHQLERLPYSQNEIIDRLTNAIIEADRAGEIPLNKPFSLQITLEGHEIEVRGIVLDGELKYGTFFIPKGK